MKIHYLVRKFNPADDHGGPACDPYGACVVLHKDGTRFRKKVTCKNCTGTKIFRGVK